MKDIIELSNVVSAALRMIPRVETKKVKKEVRGQLEVVEQHFIRDISLNEILEGLAVEFGLVQNLEDILMNNFILLKTLGVIEIKSQNDFMRISASSGAASALLQNISYFLLKCPERVSPIIQYAPIKSFKSIIEEQLSKGFVDPHLLLSNIYAHYLNATHIEPFNKLRVVSALIKGTRRKDKSSNELINVYLHVYKPEWGKYALIGSKQEAGQTDEETARLALDEDLETPGNAFSLKPSGVKDVLIIEPEIKMGLHTTYEFNLFFVTDMRGELKFREDLQYAWFTYEEIRKGVSSSGAEQIMTRFELLDYINESIGLDSIPVTVDNVTIISIGNWRGHLRQLRLHLRQGGGEFLGLINAFLRYVWKIRWVFFTMGAIVAIAIVIKPILSSNWPALGNIDSILGITTFIIYLIGVIRKFISRKE